MRTKRFIQNARTGLRNLPTVKRALEICIRETAGLNRALQQFKAAPIVAESTDPEMFPEGRSHGCCVFDDDSVSVYFHPKLEVRDEHVIFGVVGHELGHILAYGQPVPEGLDEEQLADMLFEQATGLQIFYNREMIQTVVTPTEKPMPDWIRPRPLWVGK